MKQLFIFFFLIIMLLNNIMWADDWPVLNGPYLGQKPPGKIPEVFAPGILAIASGTQP